MVQIIEEQPSFGQRFAQGLMGAGAQIPDILEKYQQKKAFEELYGPEVANLRPELQQQYMKMAEQSGPKKNEDKTAPMRGALKTIDEMRGIAKKKNIGFGSKITGIFSPETRKDRAAYETLGNSLISFASTIPIRNRHEFEKLTGKLTDPSLTLSEVEGVLNSIENIIKRNIEASEEIPRSERFERKPLTEFMK